MLIIPLMGKCTDRIAITVAAVLIAATSLVVQSTSVDAGPEVVEPIEIDTMQLIEQADETMDVMQDELEEAQARYEWENRPRSMPMYLQADAAWGGIPYASSNLENAGCGLVAASMAFEYLSREPIDPPALLAEVGETCLTGGVNDPGKFCDYAVGKYGFEASDIYWSIDDAVASVSEDSVVFASVSGTFGDNWYGGHIVLIWKVDDSGVWVMDPAHAGNSSRPFSMEELRRVNWVYFYTLRDA